MSPDFKSHLAPYIIGLIQEKHALGYKYVTQEKILKHFDNLCLEQFPDEITVTGSMLNTWSVLRPQEHPGTLCNRVTVVSHLAGFIGRLGVNAYIFPTNEFPKEPKYIPHIYTKDELQLLFRQIDCCHYSPEVPNRHFIMPVLFRVLYCCGLRLGEALRLEVEDVNLDLGVLLIRESKYGNDRYVPLSEELKKICRDYTQQVHTPATCHRCFFPSPTGGQIPSINIYTNFRRFLLQAGISHGGKGKGPRIYDLRHTFAIHCLKRMVLSGRDLTVYHQVLKTYMGHSFFKYNAYYLQVTKDMFPDIRQKIEVHYEFMMAGFGGKIDD